MIDDNLRIAIASDACGPGQPGCPLEGKKAVKTYPSQEIAGAIFAWFGDVSTKSRRYSSRLHSLRTTITHASSVMPTGRRIGDSSTTTTWIRCMARSSMPFAHHVHWRYEGAVHHP